MEPRKHREILKNDLTFHVYKSGKEGVGVRGGIGSGKERGKQGRGAEVIRDRVRLGVRVRVRIGVGIVGGEEIGARNDSG